MKEATLPKAYAFERKIYTPEDTEIPDGLFDALVEAGVLEADGSAAESSAETEEQDEDLFAGLSDEQVQNLKDAGFEDEEAIAEASVEDLVEVEQIGKATAQKLKERAS